MNESSGWWTGQRIGGWAVGLAQDVRQAMHVLVKWPAFTFVGVATRALSIAANVTLCRARGIC